MNILVANGCLTNYTGTETWTYTVVKELLVKGHKVTVFTINKGLMSDEIEKLCPVITRYEGNYDLAIVNHTNTYEKLPADLYKIFTSHSTVSEIEIPPKDCNLVTINERIQKEFGGTLIRNGIDLERFAFKPINKKLTNILYLSNPHYSLGIDIVREACKGFNLVEIKEQTFKTEEYIYQADLVISLGRGAMESMACGRNVIYADFRTGWMDSFGGIGNIDRDTFNIFLTGYGTLCPKKFNVENLRAELKKYKQANGKYLRKQAEKHFDIKNTTDQYLWMYTNKDI